MSTKKFSVNLMAKIAILSALAYIVMFFEFPLWFAPPFYKMDLSEAVVLISAFALGPLAGVVVEAIKIILNLIFSGTQTAFVGELANFAVGMAFVLPATIMYKNHKSRSTAIKGMIVGTISLCIAGAILNYVVLLPAYSYFYKMPLEALVAMGTAVNPAVDSSLKLVLLCTTPFNLLKGILTSLVVALVYKHVSPILHK